MSVETPETSVGQTDYKWTGKPTTAEETTTDEATTEDAKPVHPYKDKLETFKPKEWQLKKQIPQSSAPLEDDTYTFVDTVTLLTEMMAELRKVKEVAIAVQFEKITHFLPNCCLLEISTRSHDYIIDALTLKEELKIVNEITSDENILKVFYGTGNNYTTTPKDKFRKQGDLEIMANSVGLWVVNLFDIFSALHLSTGKNSKFGNFSELLKKQCFVDFKTLGRENVWTERPLSEDQLRYLRMRVHYLLYIHDIYRNELMEKGLLEKLYDQCTHLCRTSNTPVTGPGSHISLYKTIYRKERGNFNHRQMECFRLLFNWRYETGKENDKGLAFVLKTKDMFKLAKDLPTEVEGVSKCFADKVLPPLVESNLQVIHGLILKAIKEVTDLSKVHLVTPEEYSNKRHSTSYKDQNSNAPKRGRGGFQPGNNRGNMNYGPGPVRGFGHMNSGPGPMRGFGHMNSGPGPMRGGVMPPQPWMHPTLGSRMGPQMGPRYGQGMAPMMGDMSQGWGHEMGSSGHQTGPSGAMGGPDFLDYVINEVVGEVTQKMTQQAMGYGNNMYGMMNSRGRGGLQGGGGGPRGGRARPQGRGYGRR